MAENEATDLTSIKCSELSSYFKQVTVDTDKCKFTTADGVSWYFEHGSGTDPVITGLATATDSKTGPRYAVSMWALNGQANGLQASDTEATAPTTLFKDIYADDALINARHISTPNLFLNGTYGCNADPTVTVDASSNTTIACTAKNS